MEALPLAEGPVEVVTSLLTALTEVQRLLLLDDLWTAALEAAPSVAASGRQPEFDGLRQLASQLDDALAGAPDVASRVRRALESREDRSVDEALTFMREVVTDAADVCAPLLVGDFGETSARDVLVWACAYVENETGPEREILFDKARALAARELPDPGLRPLYRCAWMLVEVGSAAALLTGRAMSALGVGPVVLLSSVGVVGEAGRRWRKCGCPARVAAALSRGSSFAELPASATGPAASSGS